MPRSMVGLLAAVGVAMPALATYTHGALSVLVIADGAAGAAIVAYLAAAPDQKKRANVHVSTVLNHLLSMCALVWSIIAEIAASIGRAAYLAAPEIKKISLWESQNATRFFLVVPIFCLLA